jgi:hypothetical protein
MKLPTVSINGRTFKVLFPDLLRGHNPQELARLSESVSRTGRIMVPVVVDEHDGLIDGYHRLLVAVSCGLEDVPVRVEAGLTYEQKLERALDLNDARRQLTPADRKEALKNAEALRKERIARVGEARRKGKSIRTIAAKEGVSKTQVERDLAEASTVPGGTVEPDSGKVKGRDGKERRAARTAGAGGGGPKKAADPLVPAEGGHKVLGVGMIHAAEAIDCLRRIPKNDAHRAQAFQQVKDWLRRHKEG